jgi:hypothetical protein
MRKESEKAFTQTESGTSTDINTPSNPRTSSKTALNARTSREPTPVSLLATRKPHVQVDDNPTDDDDDDFGNLT